MSKALQISLLILGCLVLPSFVHAAETLYVKTAADLKSSPDAAGSVVAPLPRGAKLLVAERKGKWVKGTSNGKSGWVYEFKLSTTKPSSGDGALAGLGGGGASAREGSTAASVRGLSPTSEKYAGRANIRPEHIAMVKRMETNRVPPKEVESFLRQGKLGEFGDSP